jgi:Ca2+-binding RTX toxin-like protein
MSSLYITTDAPDLGNPFLNALLGPAVYDLASISGKITYVLQGKAGSSGYDAFGGSLWSTDGAATAFVNAVGTWTAVCNVPVAPYPFYYNGSGGTGANWVEKLDFLGSETTELGHHQLPYKGATFSMQLEGGFNNQSVVFTRENNAKGGYSFTTFVHEIGHALGLDHPHDGAVFPGVTSEGSVGSFGLNQSIFTVMSYNDGYLPKGYSPSYAYGWMSTPGAFDIAAVQALYGANMSTHAGDDVYRIPLLNQAGTSYSCLWDAGGVDTLSAEGASIACTIDLREASLLNETGGGGWLSSGSGIYGGFTIAHGAKIENAIGGQADDAVTGNDLANKIWGGGGNDTINGQSGDDLLLGEDGDDSLTGGAGADFLLGGLGGDYLDGGTGVDTATYLTAASGVTVNLTLAGQAQNTGGGGGDTLVSIENLTGSGFTDFLTGDAGANALLGMDANDGLSGGGGDDVLDGGAGQDYMVGGTGNDSYVVDNIGDNIVELTGQGVDVVYSSASYTLGANVEVLYLGVAGNLNGVGNSLDNTLVGNSQDNYLSGLAGSDGLSGGDGDDYGFGGDGDDYINGQNGADWLYGEAGFDRLYGEAGVDVLIGGEGADLMVGGLGDDGYVVDNLNDLIQENVGEGSENVYAFVNGYTLAANVENLWLFDAAMTGTGNALANVLVGNAGDNILHGLAGADSLIGGEGSDTLDAGADNDFLAGENGDDVLIGGGGSDLMYGGAGSDRFVYTAVSDSVSGANMDAILDFQVGVDKVDLSAIVTGADTVSLWANGDGTYVLVDQGSDGVEDMRILLYQTHGVTPADLIL